MADPFQTFGDTPAGASRHLTAIAPSDTVDLTTVPKAIFVGTGGDLKLIGVDAPAGATGIVLKNVPSGSTIDVRARRVVATGTTATDLVAFL